MINATMAALLMLIAACSIAAAPQAIPGIETQRLSECERAELERVRHLIENPAPPRYGRDLELEQAITLKILGTPPGQPLWPEKCE